MHYTTRDLENPFLPLVITNHRLRSIIAPAGSLYRVDRLPNGLPLPNYPVNFAFQPWANRPDISRYNGYQNIANFRNTNGQGYLELSAPAYDLRLKDAGIFNSDQWDFPQRKFANLGWIGRVHRGTPWQTVYLKSDAPNPTNWFYWAHSTETNPTNDWRLVDVFTTAINADATRGLLSVNQTNSVAWAGALGSTLVLSNNGAFISPMVISPTIPGVAPQLAYMVGSLTNGLINTKLHIPMWNPVANYSAGDVVSYLLGQYGFATNYIAVSSTNQSQNPYLQVTVSNNVSYWKNLNFWTSASNYSAGDIAAYYGVSFI